MTARRRLGALAVIAGLLLTAGLADRLPRASFAPAGAGTEIPTAAPASARSSTWFCTGATAAPSGLADGTVVVANAGTRRLTGSVTVVPVEGEVRTVPVAVGPAARAAVRLGDVVRAPHASALVELDGGQAAVEQTARGPLGDSAAPCASSASTRWYFADGATTKDATQVLSLFNPFPEDAVVDVAFTTDEGRLAPQALRGLAVVGGRMATVNVGDFAHRHPAVSTDVSLRAGRLVVGRLQTHDGSAGRKGMSLSLGAANVGDTWYFPEGMVADGVSQRYRIFNPSKQEAQVQILLALEKGEAEPMPLTVPPESTTTVVADEQPRIPKGVAHAATIASTNGVGVVAERSVDAGPPARRLGIARTLGARVAAPRWALAAGQADRAGDEWLAFFNPGLGTARVSVTVLAEGQRLAVEGLQGIRVEGGQRAAVRLRDHLERPATPALVVASAPIVVERDLYSLGGPGTSMVAGIPLR